MKSIGKEPSAEAMTYYRKLDHRTAHAAWMNFSDAVISGSNGNGELRRVLKRKSLLSKIWKLKSLSHLE